MDVLKKTPVREQDAKVRATNFEEVCLGYNGEEAKEEASRCINCKNAQCMKGCPVSINIPGFIEKVKNDDIEGAYQIISESSALPAVCRRVCTAGHILNVYYFFLQPLELRAAVFKVTIFLGIDQVVVAGGGHD